MNYELRFSNDRGTGGESKPAMGVFDLTTGEPVPAAMSVQISGPMPDSFRITLTEAPPHSNDSAEQAPPSGDGDATVPTRKR